MHDGEPAPALPQAVQVPRPPVEHTYTGAATLVEKTLGRDGLPAFKLSFVVGGELHTFVLPEQLAKRVASELAGIGLF